MRHKIIIIITLFSLSITSFAHKDTYILENYGNVKVLMKTGFEYSEINKIKIVGKLAEKISEQLKYKDTILVEYVHDYTNQYLDDLYLLEYNNSSKKLIFGIRSNYNILSNNYGLSVRIYAKKINIIDVLKLIEFTLKNKEKTNDYLTKKKIRLKNKEYNYDESPEEEYITQIISDATDDTYVKSIINANSKLISTIIKTKVDVEKEEHSGIEVYWENDKFLFEFKHHSKIKNELVFQIKDYYYSIPVFFSSNELIIFINENSFYHLDYPNKEVHKLNHIKNGTYFPVLSSRFNDKILIYDRINSFNVFLPKKNKTISKFN